MPHGRHIYSKAFGMAKAAICAYPQSDHALPHWKCVFRCCAKFPCINIPYKEIYNQYLDTTPSIRFHIYHIIVCCTAHDRIPLKNNKICCMCKQESSSDGSTKYIHPKIDSYNRDNNFWFSNQFLYSSHKKVRLSPTTCAHTWYK